MTLTEFLLARIGEDEAAVAAFDKEWRTTTVAGPVSHAYVTDTEYMSLLVDPSRVLAECEAKRRIVAEHEIGIDPCDAHDGYTMRSIPCDTVLALAAVYADHPDYCDEWRP